ncbi:DUF1822 family protein [Leptolyngbya sp. FACHB-261]|nr:DUF1822 family protein [Leptolyngbya sp. FACHB-261]
MLDSLVNPTDLRLSLPPTIWLETEHFEQAQIDAQLATNEENQWQRYLNGLALSGFETWLQERLPEQRLSRGIATDETASQTICYLTVGEFKLGLITTEHLLDELVNVPSNSLEVPELAAHFYVVLEVAEEEEQVLVRGFLRYDQLSSYLSTNRQPSNGFYHLPLSLWDAEPNHLLVYCRCLEPNAIPLPVAPTEAVSSQTTTSPITTNQPDPNQPNPNPTGTNPATVNKLGQWLQGLVDEGWQALDSLLGPGMDLAISTRQMQTSVKRGKLVDLGIHLDDQSVALLVTTTREPQEKIGVLIQLHPVGGARYLPTNLNLSLLSQTDRILQEVQSRNQDNYIQLKPFRGTSGQHFSVEVSFGDVSVREEFEL